jgi:F0F1-type ATP synthase assembly protein I
MGDAMGDDDNRRSLRRSLETLNRTVQRGGPAAAASYSLIGAIVLFGGVGYAVDRWLGWAPWGLLTGLGVGLVVGFYQLALAVWRR